MNTQTTNSEKETPTEDKQEGDMNESKDMTPMDEAISMVQSYMDNPKLVTRETLANLKGMLEDMKPMLDGDQRDGMDEPIDNGDMGKGGHGIAIMIGNMKKRGDGK